jgi:hypothetical protein
VTDSTPKPHHWRGPDEKGVILVDFDRTLATYDTWETTGIKLGAPIPAMVERVKRWRLAGYEVRIFTARAAGANPRREDDIRAIMDWCETVFGARLHVTAEKDFKTVAIWDDRAISVEPNTGWRWSATTEPAETGLRDPLSYEEELTLCDWPPSESFNAC